VAVSQELPHHVNDGVNMLLLEEQVRRPRQYGERRVRECFVDVDRMPEIDEVVIRDDDERRPGERL
jgi:hypothetical protein